jgi:hypothetical protein
VLGDANELNWLAVLSTRDKVEPRIIDVDSWGIGHWPVTAIMPSIRDWHAKGFSRETDWFSWGVVTFQLFSGIHPYKGTLNGFGRGDLEGRMKANKSVFALGVRLNQAVRDFSCIPSALLDWYRSVFEHGERTAPPFPFDRVGVVAQVRVMRATTTGSGVLIFNKLFGKSGDPIIRVWPSGVVLLSSGALIDLSSKRLIGSLKSSKGEVIKAEGGWLIADWENGNPEYTFVSIAGKDGVKLSLPMTGWCFMRHQDRLFLVTDRGLTEIICKFIGRPLLAVGQTWGVMVNATSWFDGVGVQDAMGAMFVVVPFGANSCTSIRVPELDNVKTVFAKAGNRFVAIVVIDKKGNYKKLELTFDSDYKAYKIWQGDVDDSSLNVTMLPRGVCATIANDGELDIFVPRNAQLNRVKDKYISTDMMLANWEERVVYIQGGEVWEMRMK